MRNVQGMQEGMNACDMQDMRAWSGSPSHGSPAQPTGLPAGFVAPNPPPPPHAAFQQQLQLQQHAETPHAIWQQQQRPPPPRHPPAGPTRPWRPRETAT